MQIKKLRIDPQWQSRLESIGYDYHTLDEIPYWIDDYYYEIRNRDADLIYKATNEMWQMCLDAVEYIISNKQYQHFHIPPFMIPHMERTWENDDPAIY